MKYISVEEFQRQPKEVQQVFLDWWKPSKGDIFQFVEEDNTDRSVGVLESKKQIEIASSGKGEYRIPLFTECQLREFIEDKLQSKIDYLYNPIKDSGYCITTFKPKEELKSFMDLGHDFLNGLWKVACQMAKEGVDEQRKL